MDVAMIGDRMLPIGELDKAYLDRGLYFGDGVYEVLRSYHGRPFELAASGHTPFHTHAFEHEVIILGGDIALITGQGPTPVKKDDVLLVAPNEQHQFKNQPDILPAQFICLVPIAYQKSQITSATLRPSTAAEMMPPAYPAPSPAG